MRVYIHGELLREEMAMKRKRETAWLLCLAMLVPSVCASEATPPEAAKEPPVQSADLTKEEEEKLR